MENIPEKLKYTTTHEWIFSEQEGIFIIGITDHAQQSLGDVVYVELPKVGSHFMAKQAFGVIESVKAASDLYCPISGEVIAINELLATQPELINQDVYQQGWMIKLKADNPLDEKTLLDAKQYAKEIT